MMAQVDSDYIERKYKSAEDVNLRDATIIPQYIVEQSGKMIMSLTDYYTIDDTLKESNTYKYLLSELVIARLAIDGSQNDTRSTWGQDKEDEAFRIITQIQIGNRDIVEDDGTVIDRKTGALLGVTSEVNPLLDSNSKFADLYPVDVLEGEAL